MLNKVILMGRITHEPELKASLSGISVLTFSLAVERNYSRQGEERQTDFINCVAWRQTAEFIAKYFPKGALIAVEGELQTRKYAAKDGSERTVTEVIVSSASFTGEKRSDMGDAGYKTPPKPSSAYYGTDNEERSVRAIEGRQRNETKQTIDISDFEEIAANDNIPF